MYAHILVPVDGSATSERGLDEAIALATRLGATLHLINVVDAHRLIGEVSVYSPPEQLLEDWREAGERLVAACVDRARAKGVAADGVVRLDPKQRVHEMILTQARDCHAELIVMGTHGRRGLHRLTMGSDAELVVRDCGIPVLLVRGPSDGRDKG